MTMDPGPRRGLGCSPRILIGIVIALISLATYYFRTQVNPVTGEKQHVTLSPEQEIRLGLQSAPEMAAQMGGEVSPSDPAAQLVRQVGGKIASTRTAAGGPWKYEFHLLADPNTVNAFALPGGQIFITRGLLSRLQNEAQLAGVLGHEAGHVIERHSAQQMAKANRDQMLVLATGVGASDDRSNRGQMAAAAAAVVAQMSQLKFSRTDETESDEWGVKLMVEAGYDPSEMIGVMKVLQAVSRGGRQPEFLQTHPYPEHREEHLREILAKQFPSGVPANLSKGRELPGSRVTRD